MQEPYRKGGKENSESILASMLAGDIVKCCTKHRQRYRWAGQSSFEKPLDQDADLSEVTGKATRSVALTRVANRSCVVEEPAHAEKQHAREPGDHWNASLPSRSRPA